MSLSLTAMSVSTTVFQTQGKTRIYFHCWKLFLFSFFIRFYTIKDPHYMSHCTTVNCIGVNINYMNKHQYSLTAPTPSALIGLFASEQMLVKLAYVMPQYTHIPVRFHCCGHVLMAFWHRHCLCALTASCSCYVIFYSEVRGETLYKIHGHVGKHCENKAQAENK